MNVTCHNCGYQMEANNGETYIACPQCGNAVHTTQVAAPYNATSVSPEQSKTNTLLIVMILLTVMVGLGLIIGILVATEDNTAQTNTPTTIVIDNVGKSAENSVSVETPIPTALPAAATAPAVERIDRVAAISTMNKPYNRYWVNDVEEEVRLIRARYDYTQKSLSSYTKKTSGKYTFYVTETGETVRVDFPLDNRYSACFYYEYGTLYFAFVFDGKKENRFYMHQDSLFRWIDENRVTHDNDYKNASLTHWTEQLFAENDRIAQIPRQG